VAPHNFEYGNLCYLVESAGWVFSRQQGSHRIYKHLGVKDRIATTINVQNNGGKAKPAQIKQVLVFIEQHDLLPGGE